MERQWNWVSWAALALAGLALLVAFGGRFGGGPAGYGVRTVTVVPPPAPEAPRPEWRHDGPGAAFGERFDRELGRPERGPGFYGRGHEGFGAGWHGGRHGFGPLGMIFGLAGMLTKLVALGLLAWLLLRLFQQRRGGAPPAAPTTPAGHDPRVE